MKKSKCLDFFLNRHFMKMIVLILVSLTLLQTFYVIRLTQATPFSQLLDRETGNWGLTKNTSILIKQCVQKLKMVHIMDNAGLYFIVPNVVVPVHGVPVHGVPVNGVPVNGVPVNGVPVNGVPVHGEESDNQTGITMCVHCTPNHLHYLPDLAKQWNGPISVTVFTYGQQTIAAVKSIISLHVCNDSVRKFVSFHIVTPIKYTTADYDELFYMSIKCNISHSDMLKGDMNYDNKDVQYPSNVLRNVAIQYMSTPYILILDIDFVPSKDLNNQFQYFLKRKLRSSKTSTVNSKTAFVLPCFESKSRGVESINKFDLRKQMQDGSVRPFYFEACRTCQEDTDYEKWFQFPSMDFLDVAYDVEWERPWEPFYIAHKSHLPLYDSRFKQYGFNRISQLCEMHVAGYRFSVLNNAFLIHRGFKDSGSFHAKKSKEHQFNKQLFEQFKDELKERYPNSKHHC